MTTRPIATHARDWPLPQRVWELFVWLVLIAVLSIAARESFGAERPGAARSAPSRVSRVGTSLPILFLLVD